MDFGRSIHLLSEKMTEDVENIILQKIETLVGKTVSSSQALSMLKENELRIIENVLMGIPHVRQFVIINNKNKESLGFSITIDLDMDGSSYTIKVLDENRDLKNYKEGEIWNLHINYAT